MRRVAIPQFEVDNPGVLGMRFDFKKDYRVRHRKHHDEYFNMIKDNINTFSKNDKNVAIVDDDFNLHYSEGIIDKCPPTFDFNDFYYYNLVKKLSKLGQNSVVTHDSNWRVDDVNIITAEKGLLNLRRYI